MKKTKPKKVIYYSDELNDDFAGTNITKVKVDENFKYIHKNPLWRCASFVIYYFVAVPIIWIYQRVILQTKYVNKKALKKCKRAPSFLYGNHTGYIDAFIPNLLSLPRRNRIIASPDTVSIKGLKNLTQMLGAVPVPTNIGGMRKFMQAIDYHHKKSNITIYPEAHIWPYYTGVRPFTDTSFHYPVKHNAPVYAFFTAYTKPKGIFAFMRKANITVYVSDPIYADEGLSAKEAQKNIRDKVYNFMLEKSQFSTYSVIDYIKKEDNKKAS